MKKGQKRSREEPPASFVRESSDHDLSAILKRICIASSNEKTRHAYEVSESSERTSDSPVFSTEIASPFSTPTPTQSMPSFSYYPSALTLTSSPSLSAPPSYSDDDESMSDPDSVLTLSSPASSCTSPSSTIGNKFSSRLIRSSPEITAIRHALENDSNSPFRLTSFSSPSSFIRPIHFDPSAVSSPQQILSAPRISTRRLMPEHNNNLDQSLSDDDDDDDSDYPSSCHPNSQANSDDEDDYQPTRRFTIADFPSTGFFQMLMKQNAQ